MHGLLVVCAVGVQGFSAEPDLREGKLDCDISSLYRGESFNCSFNVELNQSRSWCVVGKPLGPSTSIFQLFDLVSVQLTSSGDFKLQSASEDSSFWDLATTEAARDRLRHKEESSMLDSVLEWGAYTFGFAYELVIEVVAGEAGEQPKRQKVLRFSPFYMSCIKIRPTTSARSVQVTTALSRAAALRFGVPRRPQPSSGAQTADAMSRRDVATIFLGAAVLLVLILLLCYAQPLSQSLVLHYASGVSLSMVLGVALLIVFAWRRMNAGSGRYLVAVFSFFGSVQLFVSSFILKLWEDCWLYIVGYFVICGAVGYFWTFYRLRGGRPEPWQCSMVAQLVRLGAGSLLLLCSYSARGSILLLVTALAVWLTPRAPFRFLGRWLGAERGAAAAPRFFEDDASGERRPWRPATPSGKYLSEAEYQHSAQVATGDELRSLFSSPAYQRWLLNNHQRLNCADQDADALDE